MISAILLHAVIAVFKARRTFLNHSSITTAIKQATDMRSLRSMRRDPIGREVCSPASTTDRYYLHHCAVTANTERVIRLSSARKRYAIHRSFSMKNLKATVRPSEGFEADMSDTDVVIIGAGHNGLTGATYLAMAGLRVRAARRTSYPLPTAATCSPAKAAPWHRCGLSERDASAIGDFMLDLQEIADVVRQFVLRAPPNLVRV